MVRLSLIIFLCLFGTQPAMPAAAHEAPRAALAAPDVIATPSHVGGLSIRLLHRRAPHGAGKPPVLFVHGSSFPSDLSAAFAMDGHSWMDVMAAGGYDSFALDFLGYGRSDRYPEMLAGGTRPVGRAREALADLERAVEFIRARTGSKKLVLIAHSWGGLPAAAYAQAHPDKVAALVLFAAITPRASAQAAPQPVARAANDMAPEERIRRMDALRPPGHPSVLEGEVFTGWGARWLASDPHAAAHKLATVRFPAGPDQDIAELLQGVAFYDPADIATPTLLIRGAWDAFPADADFRALFDRLVRAPYKSYVTVPEGSHVMHLERKRHRLYTEVLLFLSSQAR